jgi:hypothetical protein
MQMGDEDNLNAVGIDSEFSHGDHGGSATINKERSVTMLDIEASVEATPAAKRISATQKSKFHWTPRVPFALRSVHDVPTTAALRQNVFNHPRCLAATDWMAARSGATATNQPSAIHELPARTERIEQYALVFVKSGANSGE